jgi:hypothetical protein
VTGKVCILLTVKIAKVLEEVPTALAFILCLFAGHLATFSSNSIGSVCREVEGVFRDPERQWMAVLCAETYLVAFFVIRNQRVWDGMLTVRGVDLCRGAFLAFSALVYFLHYGPASQSVQAVMVLGGAALGSAAWVNVFWRDASQPNKRSFSRLLRMTVCMLVIACFWKSAIGPNVSYKQNARWEGPWDSPNLYGALMGVGLVLAEGLAVEESKRNGSPALAGIRRTLGGRLALTMLLLLAGGSMAVGLWKSYSRGGWLAFSLSAIYLVVHWRKQTTHHVELTTGHYPLITTQRLLPTRNCSFAFALCAFLALMFWQYQHTDSVFAHRAISASNQNDFSWRNRVAAWEGGLQMIAEKPWLGLGWNQPEPFYGHYYSPSRLDETMAIQLNDYLMLGASVGIPALFCFGMYLCLSFAEDSRFKVQSSKFKVEDADAGELDWLKAVCRAGALVLAVGFWFDGGLFKLPTAATFWILLELGRVD